jgi:hypothetical protein
MKEETTMRRQLTRIWLLTGLVMCLGATGWAEEGQEVGKAPPKLPPIDELVKPARRSLTPEEAEEMAKLITNAISLKGWSLERINAIRALGDIIGHVAVIPVLEKIARDRQENKYIRATAVRTIARIPDEQAIEVLIGILDEADKDLKINPKDQAAEEVRFAAKEMLFRLLAPPVDFPDPRKTWAENFRLYWGKVRKKIDLRKSVYVLKVITY